MSVNPQHVRNVALIHELETASSILGHGLRIAAGLRSEAQDVPAALHCLAFGAEKLLKLTYVLAEKDAMGVVPRDTELRKKFRHGVVDLEGHTRGEIRGRCGVGTGGQGYLAQLLSEVDADPVVPAVLRALGDWGAGGRYSHVSVYTHPAPAIEELWEDPRALWREIEDAVALPAEALMSPNVRGALNQAIVDSVRRWWELYFRAWQHGLLGAEARQLSSEIDPSRVWSR